jgi:hypothetical protein
MFDVAEERKGIPWVLVGGLAAFGALLAAGYLMIT